MKRTLLAAMAISMAATPAMAQEVVTLRCMVPDNSEANAVLKQWDVTIDEANQVVSWTHDRGTYRNAAIFTPNRITIVDTRSARLRALDPNSESYLDRQTGQIVFNGRFGLRVGECERVTVTQRF